MTPVVQYTALSLCICIIYSFILLPIFYIPISTEYYDYKTNKYDRKTLLDCIYPPKLLWHLFVLIPFLPLIILMHTVNLFYHTFLLLKKIYAPIMNMPLPWVKQEVSTEISKHDP